MTLNPRRSRARVGALDWIRVGLGVGWVVAPSCYSFVKNEPPHKNGHSKIIFFVLLLCARLFTAHCGEFKSCKSHVTLCMLQDYILLTQDLQDYSLANVSP